MRLSYTTVKAPVSYEIPKIKGSKFIGHIISVNSKIEAEKQLKIIQNKYHQATHNCFGYRVGIRYHQDLFGNWLIDPEKIYASDDGEPSGSASYPIKNVLKGSQLENILLVITRYFGGTKLGIGGLVQAYTDTAKSVIAHADIITKEVLEHYNIEIAQENVPYILNYCNKHHIEIISQKYTEKAYFTLALNVAKKNEIIKALKV